MRKLLAVTLTLLSIAAAAAPAQPPTPLATVPFSIVGDHIVVDAQVNGRAGRFILDTGSGAATVVPDFANGLDLQTRGAPVEVSGAGSGTTTIRMGEAREVKLGSLTLGRMPIMVLTADPFKPIGQPMSGAFGYDVFAKWAIEIDFAAEKLNFYQPSAYWPPKDAIVMPIDLSLRIPTISVEVRPRPNARPVHAKLVLDTGTSRFVVVFAKDFAARHGIASLSPRRTLALGTGSAGLSIGDVMRVAEVNVGGFLVANPVAGVPADKTGFFASGVADGTIGQGLFKRGKLTVDYPHNRIVFEPGPAIDAAWEYPERCGWMLGKTPAGDWTVLFVGDDTPASEAGVRMGDVVTALGGRQARSMDRETVRQLCTDDGNLSVAVRRDAPGAVLLTIHKRKLI